MRYERTSKPYAAVSIQDFVLDVMGAFSVTKTVLGVYGLMAPDQDDSEYGRWVVMLGELCQQEGLPDSGVNDLAVLWQLREDWLSQGHRVSEEQRALAAHLGRKYVDWVFDTFPCFERLPGGGAQLRQ